MPKHFLPLIKGGALALLAAGLLWQTMSAGTAGLRSSAIHRAVVQWEPPAVAEEETVNRENSEEVAEGENNGQEAAEEGTEVASGPPAGMQLPPGVELPPGVSMEQAMQMMQSRRGGGGARAMPSGAPPRGRQGGGGRGRASGIDMPEQYKPIVDGPLFGPSRPSAPRPTVTAVFGDSAIVNDNLVSVGDNVGNGYRVVEINGGNVVVEREGERTTLGVF